MEALASAAARMDVGAEDPIGLSPGDTSRDAIELIEEWRGQGVAEGRRALLLRLHYRASGRSVTDTEVQALHERIVAVACTELRSIDADLQVR